LFYDYDKTITVLISILTIETWCGCFRRLMRLLLLANFLDYFRQSHMAWIRVIFAAYGFLCNRLRTSVEWNVNEL